MRRTQPRAEASVPVKILLTEAEAAQALGVSERQLWYMVAQEKIPRPCRIGKRGVRWRVTELIAAADALPSA